MSRPSPAAKDDIADVIFEMAQMAWREARYDEVLEILGDRGDPQARLLLAETGMRRQQYRQIVQTLKGIEFASPESRVKAEILRNFATQNVDGLSRRILVPEDSPNTIRALVHLHEAQSAWALKNHTAAFDSAQKALASGNRLTRARALDLQARVENVRHRPSEAVVLYVNALSETRRLEDEHFRVNTLQGLAFSALQILDVSLVELLDLQIANTRVTKWLARPYQSTLLSIAALKGLAGDAAGQLQALLAAKSVKPDAPFTALPDIQLATFHRMRGNDDTARFHLDFAFAELKDVNWSKVDLEGRMAGVWFACEASLWGDKRAAATLTRAISAEGVKDFLLAFEHDQRCAATALLARARIAEGRGLTESALADAEHAQQIWSASGDRYRGVIAAIDVMRLSGDEKPSKYLREFMAYVKSSSLRREIEKLSAKARSPLSRLGEAELKVLEQLCKGLTSQQIAAELDRSPSTIRNQTISIFRKFGVSTRSELVAKAK